MKRSDRKPLGCGICPYKTNSACHLERHLRIHTGQKPYACNMCSYRATDGGLLKRHMRIHSGEKPFTCPICGHKTAQSCSLKDHMAVHTGKKRYACEMCPFQCSRIGRLRDHQLHHQVVPIKSEAPTEQCHQPDDSSTNDQCHQILTVQEGAHKCQQCGLGFTGISDLNAHLATVHSASEPAGPSHVTPEPPFQCTLCATTVESIETLNEHFSRHIMYRCLECDSSFETPVGLLAHAPDHSEECIFNCNKCDFKSKTRNELRGHERIHNNSQSQVCKECDFVSKSGTEFSQHLQTHTSTEMVQCNICLTKFSRTTELREHMVVHYTRSRPRVIRKPTKFLAEETVDSNMGTFHCFYCSYKCSEEDQMSKHIEAIHITHTIQENNDGEKAEYNKTDEANESVTGQIPEEAGSSTKSENDNQNTKRHPCPCTSYGLHCLRHLEYHYQHLSHFMNPSDSTGPLPDTGRCRFCQDPSDGSTGETKGSMNVTSFSLSSQDKTELEVGNQPVFNLSQHVNVTEDELLKNNKTSAINTNIKRTVGFKCEKIPETIPDQQVQDLKGNSPKRIKTEHDSSNIQPDKQEDPENETTRSIKNYLDNSKSAKLLFSQLKQFFSESFPKMQSPSTDNSDSGQQTPTIFSTEDKTIQDILTIELSSDSNASDE